MLLVDPKSIQKPNAKYLVSSPLGRREVQHSSVSGEPVTIEIVSTSFMKRQKYCPDLTDLFVQVFVLDEHVPELLQSLTAWKSSGHTDDCNRF
jgi:hypothetical protein